MVRHNIVVNKKRWEATKRNLTTNSNKSAQVGWFMGSRHSSSGLPTAQLASWLEYGHRNGGMFEGTVTPPRPFMRAGFAVYLRDNPEFSAFVYSRMMAIASGTKSWDAAFREIAPYMAKALEMIMRAWNDPRNSQATIALKGFDDPLIETGELVDSIQWRVRNRGAR